MGYRSGNDTTMLMPTASKGMATFPPLLRPFMALFIAKFNES